MNHRKSSPKTLSDAIQRLENVSQFKSDSFDAEHFKSDIDTIKSAFESMKSQFETMAHEKLDEAVQTAKEKMAQGKEHAKNVSREVDQKVHENAWWAVGIVGLIALFIGYILGRKD